ncbi:hypothetical protein [Glycomyces tenuis]|uniref:hypothetical protein n=1 Tax=Glycomyces tenuis TaxID=58116 RepID=UPI0003F9C66F|nr:hypothetical protein [Glycomyces tenuis]
MTDRYRLGEPPPSADPETRPASNGTDMLLWIVLVLALALNGALSLVGLDLLGAPFGLVALFCGVTLLIRYFQRRK